MRQVSNQKPKFRTRIPVDVGQLDSAATRSTCLVLELADRTRVRIVELGEMVPGERVRIVGCTWHVHVLHCLHHWRRTWGRCHDSDVVTKGVYVPQRRTLMSLLERGMYFSIWSLDTKPTPPDQPSGGLLRT